MSTERRAEVELLDADGVARVVARMTHQLLEHHPDASDLVVIGIHTRGAVLARRLGAGLATALGAAPLIGDLDIAFYRDDLGEVPALGRQNPVIHATHLGHLVLDDRPVVLVDDVLHTGRTVRAALAALLDYGRPRRVQLAVLVDRGGRELPVRPEYVGLELVPLADDRIDVLLRETDHDERVVLSVRA